MAESENHDASTGLLHQEALLGFAECWSLKSHRRSSQVELDLAVSGGSSVASEQWVAVHRLTHVVKPRLILWIGEAFTGIWCLGWH